MTRQPVADHAETFHRALTRTAHRYASRHGRVSQYPVGDNDNGPDAA